MSLPASLVRRDQRTALLPIGGTFVVFGMFWGSWAVATADVRSTYGLSDAQLGSLLAVAVSVSGIVGAVVGNRAERWGAVPTLVRSLLVWAVLLTLTGAARTRTEFIVVFIATMAAGGCVDMTMNAASASRLGQSPGRLVRFHGIFNVGALLGAIALGSLVQAHISWRWVWPMVAVVAVPLAVWVHLRGSDPDRPATQPVAGDGGGNDGRAHLSFARSLRQLHADGLLVLLVVFATAEIVEGGVDTWGVLYLRTHLAVTALVGASAYGLGQVIAILTRGLGGPSLGRIGPRLGVIAGAVAAGTGLSLEALAGTRLLAGIGLALAAGGSAVFWPLLMAHVSTVASRPTATVSAFTAAGYLGWVAGAPIIGLLADTWGLGVGLGVIAGLAGLVAVIMAGGRHL
jgi:MFS family permease